MTAVEMLLHQPVAQAIGWALVHFVWQGTLIAVVTGLLLAALRRSAADVRYVVATIALTLMVTLPTVTAVQAWRAATVVRVAAPRAPENVSTSVALSAERTVDALAIPSAAAAPAASPRVGAVREPPLHLLDRTIRRVRVEPWIPALLFVWLCGVTVLTLRLASGWMWVQRTKSHRAVPAGRHWQDLATRLARRLHITRPIRLLESAVVEVPTVIGWLKPAVLLPTSALAGLTPHQMEAILAHELAHIRRHDYLVNLLQTLVETLLFYHPAVWWLSRRIRSERENCCDDLAVSLCGDPVTYASALADLEELRGAGRGLVLAASGGSLLHRVRRLLGAPTHAGRAPGWLAGCIAILLMLGMAAGVVGNEALSSVDDQTAAAAQAPKARAEAARAADPARSQSLEVTTARQGENAVERRRAQAQERVADAEQAADAPRAAEAVARAADAADVAMANEVAAVAPPAEARVAATATAVAEASTQDSVRVSRGRQRGHHSWSTNGEKFELSYEGEIEFTDDDTDIRSLSPGGYFKISDGGWFGGKGVDIRADGAGAITRRYRVGIIEKPYEPEGRVWLAQMLPRFIRQSGIGAPARVARILKSKGPAGVLSEISLIEGGYGKRIYFTELFKTASLDAATVRQAFAQASREVNSDYELASLLIGSQHLINDEATRKAYFDASATIQSDYEMRRVFSAGLKAGPVQPAVLASILSAATSIEGDYELASLLVQVAKLQPLDGSTRRPFFTALDTVGGAYEHGRVLQALSSRSDLSSEILVSMLQSGARMRLDYEQAQFLIQVAKAHTIDGTLRGPFFSSVDAMKSPYEKGRVLQTVVKRGDTPAETILAVLRSAGAITGSYERSQVLLSVAANHQISGPARDAYIEAAEKLGEYEQGRALTALVKNERGRK